jgi:hypothetical protein
VDVLLTYKRNLKKVNIGTGKIEYETGFSELTRRTKKNISLYSKECFLSTNPKNIVSFNNLEYEKKTSGLISVPCHALKMNRYWSCNWTLDGDWRLASRSE